MTNSQGSEITFPVVGGIFGVGWIATMLRALADLGRIGSWHIGHWVDFRHTAIRIQFDTRADAEVAEDFIEAWRRTHVPTGDVSDTSAGKG